MAATVLVAVLAVVGTLTAIGLVFGSHSPTPARALYGQISPPEDMAPPGPLVRTAPDLAAPPATGIDTSQALTVQCAVAGAKTPEDASPGDTTSWLRVGDQAFIPYLYVDVFTDTGPVVTTPNCDPTRPALSPGTYRAPASTGSAPTTSRRVFINNSGGRDAPVYAQPNTTQPPIKTIPHNWAVQVVCAVAGEKVAEDVYPSATSSWLRTAAGTYIPSPYFFGNYTVTNCDPTQPALPLGKLGPG